MIDMIIDKNSAKWIWIEDESAYGTDVYVDFKDHFNSCKGEIFLYVSCDSAFYCNINGELAAFSSCSDYPQYKLYDKFDISKFCNEKNQIDFTVWYIGDDGNQTYIKDAPGLWYVIVNNGKVVASSGVNTLGRKNINYKNGYCKYITVQLGYSFYYDNSKVNDIDFKPCVIAENREVLPRPQKNLVLGERVNGIIEDNGTFLSVDLGKETAGFAELSFVSSIEQEIKVGYGEFLFNGRVAVEIEGRDFSFEIKAKKGKNSLIFPLRRIAGRYLEIFFQQKIDVEFIGVVPVTYPVTVVEKKFNNALVQKIYDVSIDTLRLCMHEHYEDCPWREQALYTLDSRHQMLFGYYAFKEREYQRSNLVLISKGLRSDGFLSLCFPNGRNRDIPIPSFSLAYFLQVCEYVIYTGDTTIIDEVGDTISTLANSFESKIDENGLIPVFPYPYWNFYEWTEGNDRSDEIGGRDANTPYVLDYDLTLNAFYVFAMELYNKVFNKNVQTEIVKKAITENFYVEEKGLYKNSINDGRFSQLGNAYAVLIGLGNSEILEKIKNGDGLTKASLSMRYFIYQALLTEKGKYKDYIVNEIIEKYSYMLSQGSTSFWETDNGWEDFGGAGSLCHGWSALPIYFFNNLLD